MIYDANKPIIYDIKQNHISITVIANADKLTEKQTRRGCFGKIFPVYSLPNYSFSASMSWEDIFKFCRIDSRYIDYAYPQGYTDDRVFYDTDVTELGGPMWDYREEKTKGIGLPLYRSEIFEVLSAIIRLCLANSLIEETYQFDDNDILREVKIL